MLLEMSTEALVLLAMSTEALVLLEMSTVELRVEPAETLEVRFPFHKYPIFEADFWAVNGGAGASGNVNGGAQGGASGDVGGSLCLYRSTQDQRANLQCSQRRSWSSRRRQRGRIHSTLSPTCDPYLIANLASKIPTSYRSLTWPTVNQWRGD